MITFESHVRKKETFKEKTFDFYEVDLCVTPCKGQIRLNYRVKPVGS